MKKITIVPICPRCHSNNTGFYIHSTVNGIRSDVIYHAKRGERIRPVLEYGSIINNCFCADCETVWKDVLIQKKVSDEEIKKIIESKHLTTSDLKKDFYIKKQKKQNKSEKIKSVVKKIMKLI